MTEFSQPVYRAAKPSYPVRREQQATRLSTVWKRKWLVVAFAAIFALAGLSYSLFQPSSYSATATVQVMLLQTANSGEQNALAANELAAQYSQIATSRPVLSLAERTLDDERRISEQITAAPINNYNVIAITVSAGTASRPREVSTAVADALVTYINDQRKSAIAAANSDTAQQLKQIDAAIASAQRQIARDIQLSSRDTAAGRRALAQLGSERSLLASLINNRSATFTGPLRELQQAQPLVRVTTRPKESVEAPSRAALFALIGLVVGALVGAEFVVLSAQIGSGRRGRRPRPGVAG